MEDEGELHDLLGVEFKREEGHVNLHQTSYVVKLVERHLRGVVPDKCKSNATPCDKNLKPLVEKVVRKLSKVFQSPTAPVCLPNCSANIKASSAHCFTVPPTLAQTLLTPLAYSVEP